MPKSPPLMAIVLILSSPALLEGHSKLGGSSNQAAEHNVSPRSWREFKPQSVGSSILMPGSPSSTRDTVKLDSPTVPVAEYNYKTGQIVYFVLRLGDFPENHLYTRPVVELFDWASRLLLEHTKDGKTQLPKVSEQRDLSLDNHPGRHYETECGPYKKSDSGPCEVSLRIYKVERTIYILGLVRPKAGLPADQVNKYFGSFKLESDRGKDKE